MDTNIAVNVFLYDESTKSVLLQLRDNNPEIANPNVWCLPGGGAEPEDASAEAAARRELLEETDYTSDHMMFMGKDIAFSLERYFFVTKYDSKQTISTLEGQRMEFVPLSRLPDNVWVGHVEWINRIGESLNLAEQTEP